MYITRPPLENFDFGDEDESPLDCSSAAARDADQDDRFLTESRARQLQDDDVVVIDILVY